MQESPCHGRMTTICYVHCVSQVITDTCLDTGDTISDLQTVDYINATHTGDDIHGYKMKNLHRNEAKLIFHEVVMCM